MGIVFEEEDNGIKVVDLQGAALQQDLCIRDQLVAINNQSVREWPLERVLETIGSLATDPNLTFERDASAVVVQFHGRRIAAQPGEHICDLAWETHSKVQYQCRNGVCGTCEQVVVGKGQYLRPCVARVPRDCQEMALRPSDRLAP